MDEPTTNHSNPRQKPSKLNWTKVLYDHNIFIDSQAYRKWDGDLKFEGRQLLEKDLIRTRSNQPFFQKESTQEILRRLVTFYCKGNKVSYQQGLLEVVIPFALLHRKDFELRKCYAYFNAFMKKHFPKVLTQRIIDHKKELPHALLAISLAQTLLRYHYPDIYMLLLQNEIPLSMIITQEILTVFAKNLPLEQVYRVYDHFINKKDKNSILYMSIALIGMHQEEIHSAALSDELHIYTNKGLKSGLTLEIMERWFLLSDKIQQTTPSSFMIFSRNLGFTNHSVLTREDLNGMMRVEQILSQQDFIMPIYPKEIMQSPSSYLIVSVDGRTLSKCDSISASKILSCSDQKQLEKKIPCGRTLVLSESAEGEPQEQRKILIGLARKAQHRNINITYLQEQLASGPQCVIY